MSLTEPEYKENQAILKSYSGKFYKLTAFKYLRTSGIETGKSRPKGTVNEQKLIENIKRARSKVFELAICNEWTHWATFTLDKTKYDRDDLGKFRKDFAQFIRNTGKKYDRKIEYLLVPELHKDGHSWHMHGFIEGLSIDELRPFTLDENLPQYLKNKLKKGQVIYDWTSYREKFGFNDIELVGNQEAAAKYIIKYLSKNMDTRQIEADVGAGDHVTKSDVQTLGGHLYYSSQGLKMAETIKKGTIVSPMIPKYENEYIRVQEFTCDVNLEELKNMIL